MSNLRSDAREHAKTLPVGSTERTLIERLCNQIDQVEDDWHTAERLLANVTHAINDAHDHTTGYARFVASGCSHLEAARETGNVRADRARVLLGRRMLGDPAPDSLGESGIPRHGENSHGR